MAEESVPALSLEETEESKEVAESSNGNGNGKHHWMSVAAVVIASMGFVWNIQDRAAGAAETQAVTRTEMDFWVNDYREFKTEQKEETKAIRESMRIQTLDMKDLKGELKETKAMSQNTLDLMRQWDKGWKKQ